MVSTPNSPIDLLTKFERILRLIDMEESIILGDVNCNILENNHIGDHSTNELNFITNLYQYKQLINDPTNYPLKNLN